MNNKICLITPGHISTNPRLIKEAIALTRAGYTVHIVFTQYMNYLLEEDSRILKANPSITFDSLDWTDNSLKSKSNRISTGFYQKLCLKLNKRMDNKIFQRIIINRNFHWQLKKAVYAKAGLYIAHNAGALSVAAEAAAITSALFSFDAEDYHRGELLSEEILSAIISIENTYLPDAEYITAASPLITKEYSQLFNRNVFSVNNVFSSEDSYIPPSLEDLPLKLFWFSQSIGTNRGIQDVLKAMKLLEGKNIEFHLYGLMSESTKKEFDQLAIELDFNEYSKVFYKSQISPESLLKKATEFNIGLAIEPGFCENNKIALSNKIFTYLLGGNAIIFSNTPAQELFFKLHSDIGAIYEVGDYRELSKIILKYYNNRLLLLDHMKNSRKLFDEKFNWEIESKTFLDCINKCFL